MWMHKPGIQTTRVPHLFFFSFFFKQEQSCIGIFCIRFVGKQSRFLIKVCLAPQITKWVLMNITDQIASTRYGDRQKTRTGFNNTLLVHVWRVVVRQMVIGAFDADVLDLPPLVWVRGAAWAELVFKQRLDLLQAPRFGFWQAAIDEEEAQQGHAGVQEKSSWGKQKAGGKKVNASTFLQSVWSINVLVLIHHLESSRT